MYSVCLLVGGLCLISRNYKYSILIIEGSFNCYVIFIMNLLGLISEFYMLKWNFYFSI